MLLMLFSTTAVMAQNTDPAVDATPQVDWLSVSYYVLMFLILCVSVGVVGKILRVYDLTQQLQGKKPMNWNNILGVLFLAFMIIGLCGAYWSITEQGSMSLPEAASKHGIKTDAMFAVTAAITLPVFVITQFLLFSFVFRYRYSDKRKGYYLPHNNTIEKAWTITPAIVLTVLVVFGFFTWREITDTTPAKGDVNVEITGHQFAWEIRYPGADDKLGKIDFRKTTGVNNLGVDFSDPASMDDLRADTIVIPVDKTVRLNIRAQDVIHSVYMPHFRVQMNAVPGLPTFFKFTPTITTADMRLRLNDPKFDYLLYCNKICGGGHYNMQKVVRVVTAAEYNEWIAQQKPYLSDALRKELKMPIPVRPSAPVADTTKKGVDTTKKTAVVNRLALNN